MENVSDWVVEEVKGVNFSDKRLNERCIDILNPLSNKPNHSIPMACKSWKETIAAYRFLNNDNVTHDTILSSHRSSTFESIKQENIVLIPQDTTEIDFSGRQTIRKTLTMDNGKEFVGHVAYRLTGFKTFFCDPYRPRQKALVEKMNSMLHRQNLA